MANLIDVKVPDIGGFKDVPVIQILVKPGDSVAFDAPLVTLESDKASMDVPAPAAGVRGAPAAPGVVPLRVRVHGGEEHVGVVPEDARRAVAEVVIHVEDGDAADRGERRGDVRIIIRIIRRAQKTPR